MNITRIEASHLPSATSLYASILQPLGIFYIGSKACRDGCDSVNFGIGGSAILQICELPRDLSQIQVSCVALSCSSSEAVQGFHRAVLRASNLFVANSGRSMPLTMLNTDANRVEATLQDVDGNRIQVTYDRFSSKKRINSNKRNLIPLTREDLDSAQLHWSTNSLQTGSSALHRKPVPMKDRSLQIHNAGEVGRSTSPSTEYTNSTAKDGGTNTSTIVSAVLGAVAGAAITYAAISGSRSQEAPQAAVQAAARFSGIKSHCNRAGQGTREESSAICHPAETRRLVFKEGDASPPLAKQDSVRSQHGGRSLLPTLTERTAFNPLVLPGRDAVVSTANVRVFCKSTAPTTWSSSPTIKHAHVAMGRQIDAPSQVSKRHEDKSETELTFVSAKSHRSSRDTQRSAQTPGRYCHRHGASGNGVVEAGRQTHSERSRVSSGIPAKQVPLPPSLFDSSHDSWSDDLQVVVPSDSISCVGANKATSL